MTKLKKKDELPEGCFNCKFADYDSGQEWAAFLTPKCLKTGKYHHDYYSCKKWRIQE